MAHPRNAGRPISNQAPCSPRARKRQGPVDSARSWCGTEWQCHCVATPRTTRDLKTLRSSATTRRISSRRPTTTRLDDSVIRDLLEDPDSLSRLYERAPEQVRGLIASDAAARDVVALEARRQQLDRFRRLLNDREFFDAQVQLTVRRRPEDVWQALFENNPWMLGVALTGQLLTSWNDNRLEQIVVGPSISTAGKRTDALMRTSGRIRSMVFTEIKTHLTPLLHEEYRSGCWSPSTEVAGAVAQLQGTVHRAVTQIGERLASEAADGSDIPGEFTYLLRPRAFVVVGDLSQLTGSSGGAHQDRIRSFELFRNQLQEPEILTFDEVFARAEWTLDLAESAGA